MGKKVKVAVSIVLISTVLIIVATTGIIFAGPDKGDIPLDPRLVTTPSFAWPYSTSYRVSSAFRYRSVETNCPANVPRGFHRGIDIPRKQEDTKLRSAVNGLVVHVGPCNVSSYGEVLAINTWHGVSPPILPLSVNDFKSKSLELDILSNGRYIQVVYAHMKKDSIRVKVGDVVHMYQYVGEMGNTGVGTGVHLHFETRLINSLWSPFVENPSPSKSVFVNPISRNQKFFNSATLNEVAKAMTSCRLPGEDFFGDPVFGTKPSGCCTSNCSSAQNDLGHTNYNVHSTIKGVAGILKGDYFIPVEYLAELSVNEISRLGITLDDLSKAKEDADSKEIIIIEELSQRLTQYLNTK